MSTLWNNLVDGMGSILAFVYSVIPNYGFAITQVRKPDIGQSKPAMVKVRE